MALEIKPAEDILASSTATMRVAFQGRNVGERTFLGQQARAWGIAAWHAQGALEDVARDQIPSERSSLAQLELWAILYALPDGEGGYGLRKPTRAAGGAATLTGTNGAAFTAGLTATTSDGQVQIELLADATIPAGTGYGSIGGSFRAVTPGLAGNLPAGTTLLWDATPLGASTSFVLTVALTGGLAQEGTEVIERIRQATQGPRRGGVDADYVAWVTLDTDGNQTDIVAAYVYPKRSGEGTVDIVATVGGSGTGRIPTAEQLAEAQARLETLRPACAAATTVIAPNDPGAGYAVRSRMVPNAAYPWDWTEDGAPYTVDLYTPGSPPQLRLNTLAPTSLKAAIDNYIANAADAPRLQVISTGTVANIAIRAVAWADSMGKTTLDLEDVPDGWAAPTVGDAVHTYGPIVAPVAARIVALADMLGPSRASGFASTLLPWADRLTISGIVAAAETALDTDGTELVDYVLPNGTTINGVEADVVPGDSTGGQGPDLLYLSSVAVTP